MSEWIHDHQAVVWAAFAASLLIFVGSLIVMPAIVVRIPADYFDHAQRPESPWAHRHPLIQLLLRIGKNMLGAVLALAGIAMLVLPGQGLLTLLVGVLLIDFPGKYRFEKWLVARKLVRRPINWLRRRANHEPLRVDGR